MSEWYVYGDGAAVVGPVTTEQVVRGLVSGKVPTDALVQPADGGVWKPILDIEEFDEAAQATVAFGTLPVDAADLHADKPSARPPPPPDRASIKLAVDKASAAKMPVPKTSAPSPAWMVRVGGEVKGPVTSEQLHRAIGAGLLDEDVQVLSLAGGEWAPFSKVAVQQRPVVAATPSAARPVPAPPPSAASPVVARAPSATSPAPHVLFRTPASTDPGSIPAMRETKPSLLAVVTAKVLAANDPVRRRRHQQIGVAIVATFLVVALIAVIARDPARAIYGDATDLEEQGKLAEAASQYDRVCRRAPTSKLCPPSIERAAVLRLGLADKAIEGFKFGEAEALLKIVA